MKLIRNRRSKRVEAFDDARTVEAAQLARFLAKPGFEDITAVIGPGGGGSTSYLRQVDTLVIPAGSPSLPGDFVNGVIHEFEPFDLGDYGAGIVAIDLVGDGGVDDEQFGIYLNVPGPGAGPLSSLSPVEVPGAWALMWDATDYVVTGFRSASTTGGPLSDGLPLQAVIAVGADDNGDGTTYSDITIERARVSFVPLLPVL